MRGTVICIRTNEGLRKTLEKICAADRRSLSSMVRRILYDYVEKMKQERQGPEVERRFYPRRGLSSPSLVTGPDGAVHAGTISDISLGGARVSVPKDFTRELRAGSRISLVFALPGSGAPLSMRCALRHVSANGQVSFGGAFVDGDADSCRLLQVYLADGRERQEKAIRAAVSHPAGP